MKQIVTAGILLFILASAGFSQTDSDWSSAFNLSGVTNGVVYAIAEDSSGNVWIGGSFSGVDGIPSKNLAYWDGSKWNGFTTGANNTVFDIEVDGTGTVFIGGAFSSVEGVSANLVARWNGVSWSALPGGLSGTGGPQVWSLAIDENDDLWIGGFFQSPDSNLVKFDGTSFTGFTYSPNSTVRALHHTGTRLVAAGSFSTVGGISTGRLATFDGVNWRDMGANLSSSSINSITSSSGNTVYVGGSFTSIGGVSTNYLAKADITKATVTWSGFGLSVNGSVQMVDYNSTLGLIFLGGTFSAPSSYLATLNTSGTFNPTGTPAAPDLAVYSLKALESGVTTIGGTFYEVGGNESPGIAQIKTNLSSRAMTAVTGGWGANSTVAKIVKHPVTGSIIVAGSFTRIGGIEAPYLASFNGTSWSGYGSGPNGTVNDIDFMSDGDMIIGGQFTEVNGVSANRVARLNGKNWEAVAADGPNNTVYAVTVTQQDSVFIGGVFTQTAGFFSLQRFAKLHNGVWVNRGASGTPTVFDLTTGPDTSVYVAMSSTLGPFSGGTFNRVGNYKNGVYNNLLNGTTAGIAYTWGRSPDNTMLVGGTFGTMFTSVGKIAEWTGSTWAAVSMNSSTGFTGISDEVRAISTHSDGRMFIGGLFTAGWTQSASNLLMVFNDVVYPMGSGTNSTVYTVCVDEENNEIWVGGTFLTAGNKPAVRLSRMSLANTVPVELVSFTGNIAGDQFILNWSTKSETTNFGWEVQRFLPDPEVLEGTGRNLSETDPSDPVIERSRNAGSGIQNSEEWETVGFVAGSGTTNSPKSYSFQSPIMDPERSRSAARQSLFRLKQLDLDGTVSYSQILTIDASPTGFHLLGNYPNPFNPTTVIRYQLSAISEVKLQVFDVTGRLVSTLVNGKAEPGTHAVPFRATGLASGVYYYQLTAGNQKVTGKMMLIR